MKVGGLKAAVLKRAVHLATLAILRVRNKVEMFLLLLLFFSILSWGHLKVENLLSKQRESSVISKVPKELCFVSLRAA